MSELKLGMILDPKSVREAEELTAEERDEAVVLLRQWLQSVPPLRGTRPTEQTEKFLDYIDNGPP